MRLNDKSAVYVPIESASDLVKARQEGRALANQIGFSPRPSDVDRVGHLGARAQHRHVRAATARSCSVTDGNSAVQIRARDDGPGISDVTAALEPGYSTSSGLGLGLPGVRRIADAFDITSGPSGTIVNVTIMRR